MVQCRECRKMHLNRYMNGTMLFKVQCHECQKMHLNRYMNGIMLFKVQCRECRNVQHKILHIGLVSCRECRKASFSFDLQCTF